VHHIATVLVLEVRETAPASKYIYNGINLRTFNGSVKII
jgi:hypothetical protein